MFETKVTEKLGIKYPIIGGVMMWISIPEFVGAISESGGLGILASAMYDTKESFAEAIDQTQEATEKPFGVNINLYPSATRMNIYEYVDVMVDKGVNIVETSGEFPPDELYKRFKASGLIWMHKCSTLLEAYTAQQAGADIVAVNGCEKAGFTGNSKVSSLVLLQATKNTLWIPVVGGGGVVDGRSFLAMLAMGADAVMLGTRLLVTQECPIHFNVKQALIGAKETDTSVIMSSIMAAHRVWLNAAAERCAKLEESGADITKIHQVIIEKRPTKMYHNGEVDSGIMPCGQSVGLINEIVSIEELFDNIIAQAVKQISELTKFVKKDG